MEKRVTMGLANQIRFKAAVALRASVFFSRSGDYMKLRVIEKNVIY
jgi:hypothetical protein